MKPGWRTEFRPLEVQLTDFENVIFMYFYSYTIKISLLLYFHYPVIEENNVINKL